MQLNESIKQSIANSVLCWLATVSADGVPNVSPKEMFCAYGEDSVIIANIASPQSVVNIQANPTVCLSFVDIWVQKGFQLKGHAAIIDKNHPDFTALEAQLLPMTTADGVFPIASIIKMTINSAKAIVSPRYVLYPDTTEAEQVIRAQKTYGIET